jgi:hypothetical protein
LPSGYRVCRRQTEVVVSVKIELKTEIRAFRRSATICRIVSCSSSPKVMSIIVLKSILGNRLWTVF